MSRAAATSSILTVIEDPVSAARPLLEGRGPILLVLDTFDAAQIPKVVGGFLNALRNSYGFFARYAEEWQPGAAVPPVAERPLADRWLLARLDQVPTAVREAWNGYDVTAGVRAILDFVEEDLSRWYVRANRARFWAPDRAADEAALATLHEALVTVSRLLAPAAPFVADWLHRALTGTSAHLAPFPADQGRRPELPACVLAGRLEDRVCVQSRRQQRDLRDESRRVQRDAADQQPGD
jgi:isoleucyl-tRNA synthetase